MIYLHINLSERNPAIKCFRETCPNAVSGQTMLVIFFSVTKRDKPVSSRRACTRLRIVFKSLVCQLQGFFSLDSGKEG
jgi:hypothetical protein